MAWLVVVHLHGRGDRYWLGDLDDDQRPPCRMGTTGPLWCCKAEVAHRFEGREQAARFARSCDTNHVALGYEAVHVRVG